MHIGIVGAGIIGVTTAYSLAQKGYQVTLIEKNATAGLETSFANGAQLSYSYVAPLAGPGVFADLPQWMIRSDSPLRFIPRLSLHQWKWLWAFMKACNSHTANETTQALLGLSYLSRDTLNSLVLQEQLAFEQKVNGKLIIYRNPTVFEKARKQVELQSSLGGAQQKVLNTQATLEQEPSLIALEKSLAGGIYTEDEACADAYLFVQELVRTLGQNPRVNFVYTTTVEALITEKNVIQGVKTSNGEMRFDAVIIANATQSVPLLQPLGYTPLIYPLKGYSLTISHSDLSEQPIPKANVTDYDRRIVYAPLESKLRIAAMVDIGDSSKRLPPKRIQTLKQQITEVFPGLPLEKATPWAGLRPATPKGLPIIGAHPTCKGLWLNLGHGALGQTLACGSAAILSNQVAGENSSIDTHLFQP